MNQREMLNSIRVYQFCAVELNLFLDNFPEDKNAEEDYNKVSCKLTELISAYEKNFGPLTNFGSAYVENPKAWVNTPWPWENCSREEE
ncbi:spore coat protein CotJB [Clostridium beijerinckii]|uniref:Spore coat protein JB n=1 Tax=Clostridium beijerinckii TaxID=1520 RepID=A0AAX0B0Y4_CLOBE|nr:spore coat protein CotJB [Clostridium beijerinckii]NRT88089.1 spore coat protein JB [Clostridium beijerinckii]NYC73517.1 spore coat protein JB [Clostridium beijerinckii]